MRIYFDKESEIVKLLNAYKESLHWKTKEYDKFLGELKGRTVIVSLKIDGELNALHWDGKKARLYSKEGRVREDFPLLDEVSRLLKGKDESIFFGELYVVDDQGKPVSYPQAISLLRTGEPEKDLGKIRMIVFDVHTYNGCEVEGDYWERFLVIQKVFGKGKRITPASTVRGREEDVKKFWEKVKKGLAEGLVIREDTAIKIKPTYTQDLAVIGVEISEEHKWVSAIVLGYVLPGNKYVYAGKAGSGFTERERKELYSWAQKIKVKGPKFGAYKNVTWVDPRKTRVYEIESDELIFKERDVLSFSDGEYEIVGSKRSPVGRKPRVVRWRDDKEPTVGDAGVRQIPEKISAYLPTMPFNRDFGVELTKPLDYLYADYDVVKLRQENLPALLKMLRVKKHKKLNKVSSIGEVSL